MRPYLPLLLLIPSVLAGCATTTPPVDVTRFHSPQVMTEARTSISVVAQDPNLQDSLEHRTYAAAVAEQLQRLGYTDVSLVPDGDSNQVAYVTVTRDIVQKLDDGGPVSVGVGGSTGSYRSGIGVGIGINLGGNKGGERVVTELFVRINDRIAGEPIWEGRAVVDAKASAPAAQPGMAARRLAEALFQDFPGQSGETIRVP